ncbi:MAG: cytochrome-c peroxidase [Burkholderiales bacterium]
MESNLDSRKVSLGERLFNEKRLSRDNTIACASCHDLTKGGTDRLSFSIGVGGAKGAFNAPTVFNASLNFRQFWDGRANSLEEQAAGPIHNPAEVGSNWKDVIAKLGGDKAMSASFNEIYPDGLQPKNVQDAIATFQRSLTTPNSRFDRYLRGAKSAVTSEELRGYELFKNYGCVACHQGVNVGGNMFQRIGVMDDYVSKRGTPTASDLGRYNVTKKETDKFVFKYCGPLNQDNTSPSLSCTFDFARS